MFTYPIFSPNGSRFADTEYILFVDGTTPTAMRYYSVDHTAGAGSGWSLQASYTYTDNIYSITTDGQHVIIGTNKFVSATYASIQLTWGGASFTNVLDAEVTGNFTGGRCHQYDPNNPGYLTVSKGTTGLGVMTYETSPTYAWGTPVYETSAADDWMGLMDFRVNDPTATGYGDTWVTTSNTANTQHINSYTFSGTTATQYGSDGLTCSTWARGNTWAWDRDTGIIAALNGASHDTARLVQVDMDTRIPSLVGTSNSMAGNPQQGAFCNGFLVVIIGATLYSYSLSGTTLTQESTLALGGSNTTNGSMYTSPYTNRVFVYQNGTARTVDVANDGTLSTASSASINGWNLAGGAYYSRVTFAGETGLTTT